MEMLPLPMGCYFTPKPHECIQFLSIKVHGSQDSCCFRDGLIFDCDPYSAKQLPDLFSTVERRENVYFFTKLRRKGKIGSVNIDRTIIDRVGENKGSWHGDQTKEVRDADDISVIGSASTFTFWGKEGDPNNRRFLMTEYKLLPYINGNGDGHDSAALQYDPLKDQVFCHLRCAPERKGKKATTSINNLKKSFCAPPLQPPCPAVNLDMITAEAFPRCSTTPTPTAHDSASPPHPLQTPTDSPIYYVLADTDLPAMEWDDDIYAQFQLLMGTTGVDEDVLPLSSAAPLHVHTDNQLALISVAAANDSSSYRHDVELPSVLPLANTKATPSPAFPDNPIAAVEDDYDTLFDTLLPINSQSQMNGLNWDDLSEFLDLS